MVKPLEALKSPFCYKDDYLVIKKRSLERILPQGKNFSGFVKFCIFRGGTKNRRNKEIKIKEKN